MHFIIGIEGTKLTTNDIQRLTHKSVLGCILFKRNYESASQLKALTQSIKALREELVISADQEGGRVQRFDQPPFHPLLSLYELEKKTDKEVIQHASLLARELKNHGVDFTFSPVVDLYNAKSRVINTRAFSSDPKKVVELATLYIQTLRQEKMPSVLKHFPGHGSIDADSHLESAHYTISLNALEKRDLQPFIALINASLADSIMVGHITLTEIDKAIASQSSFWLKTYLREKLHFQGIIFSDDMGMFAANKPNQSATDAIDHFFAAGGDIALLCNDFTVIDRILAYTHPSDITTDTNFNHRWQTFTAML